MQLLLHRLAALLLLALAVPALAMPVPAMAQEPAAAPPREVMEAIATSPTPKPEQVIVGAYVNDIQQLDFKTNNYVIDLYVWFRWTNADIDPSKSMEFMNRFASDDNRRDALTEEPEVMPDGSRYSIIRYQGLFSTKFPLEAYPFDTQNLNVIMEDTLAGAAEQVYVPEGAAPVLVDPVITLPGFRVGKPTMRIVTNTYPTNFGDLSVGEADPYSRVIVSIPVTRPAVAMSLKTFVPILLIVVCASLVYFVRPRYVEGRIGLGITALLTLVALQLTATAPLPDVDYLMMLDKIFLLAYVFIIVALARVVATSWRGADADSEAEIKRADRRWAAGVLGLYLAANVAVIWTTLC
jgi:neurotransmitter-gated ion-channel